MDGPRVWRVETMMLMGHGLYMQVARLQTQLAAAQLDVQTAREQAALAAIEGPVMPLLCGLSTQSGNFFVSLGCPRVKGYFMHQSSAIPATSVLPQCPQVEIC